MPPPLTEQLCDHIDLLRKQHRAGLTPSFGQIDELFEMADDLRAHGFNDPPRRGCAIAGCLTGYLQTPQRVAGQTYCVPHALQVRATFDALERLLPDVYAQVARADWPTRSTSQER